jgi:uncharacterized membrane protein YvbJ
MKCPKCGFINSENTEECLKCGIVFKKFNTIDTPSPHTINHYQSYTLLKAGFNRDWLW